MFVTNDKNPSFHPKMTDEYAYKNIIKRIFFVIDDKKTNIKNYHFE